jgi:hypothetical protein
MDELSESPVSAMYFLQANEKFGQKVAPIGLLTLCSIVSARIIARDFPIGFNLCKVAPSGHFKSQTSIAAMAVAPADYYISLKADFTMHDIDRSYRGDVKNKCLLVNDGTTLLESKTHKAKSRIINGFAGLLSDGYYDYGDKFAGFLINGPCTCVFNLTPVSFRMYESRLFESTFIYRFLVVHYTMPLSEMRDYIEDEARRAAIRFNQKIHVDLKSKDINTENYNRVINEYGERWSALAGSPINRITDQVKALARAHAALNGRDEICRDDIWLLRVTESYVSNPFRSSAAKIRELHQQGRSVKDICLLLDKDPDSYKTTVSKVLSEAKMKGVFE